MPIRTRDADSRVPLFAFRGFVEDDLANPSVGGGPSSTTLPTLPWVVYPVRAV